MFIYWRFSSMGYDKSDTIDANFSTRFTSTKSTNLSLSV